MKTYTILKFFNIKKMFVFAAIMTLAFLILMPVSGVENTIEDASCEVTDEHLYCNIDGVQRLTDQFTEMAEGMYSCKVTYSTMNTIFNSGSYLRSKGSMCRAL